MGQTTMTPEQAQLLSFYVKFYGSLLRGTDSSIIGIDKAARGEYLKAQFKWDNNTLSSQYIQMGYAGNLINRVKDPNNILIQTNPTAIDQTEQTKEIQRWLDAKGHSNEWVFDFMREGSYQLTGGLARTEESRFDSAIRNSKEKLTEVYKKSNAKEQQSLLGLFTNTNLQIAAENSVDMSFPVRALPSAGLLELLKPHWPESIYEYYSDLLKKGIDKGFVCTDSRLLMGEQEEKQVRTLQITISTTYVNPSVLPTQYSSSLDNVDKVTAPYGVVELGCAWLPLASSFTPCLYHLFIHEFYCGQMGMLYNQICNKDVGEFKKIIKLIVENSVQSLLVDFKKIKDIDTLPSFLKNIDYTRANQEEIKAELLSALKAHYLFDMHEYYTSRGKTLSQYAQVIGIDPNEIVTITRDHADLINKTLASLDVSRIINICATNNNAQSEKISSPDYTSNKETQLRDAITGEAFKAGDHILIAEDGHLYNENTFSKLERVFNVPYNIHNKPIAVYNRYSQLEEFLENDGKLASNQLLMLDPINNEPMVSPTLFSVTKTEGDKTKREMLVCDSKTLTLGQTRAYNNKKYECTAAYPFNTLKHAETMLLKPIASTSTQLIEESENTKFSYRQSAEDMIKAGINTSDDLFAALMCCLKYDREGIIIGNDEEKRNVILSNPGIQELITKGYGGAAVIIGNNSLPQTREGSALEKHFYGINVIRIRRENAMGKILGSGYVGGMGKDQSIASCEHNLNLKLGPFVKEKSLANTHVFNPLEDDNDLPQVTHSNSLTKANFAGELIKQAKPLLSQPIRDFSLLLRMAIQPQFIKQWASEKRIDQKKQMLIIKNY